MLELKATDTTVAQFNFAVITAARAYVQTTYPYDDQEMVTQQRQNPFTKTSRPEKAGT